MAFAACGCGVVGPNAVKYDGVKYNEAMRHSADQQLLLNIIRTRYRDNSAYLEMVSLSTSYTLAARAEVEAEMWQKPTTGGARQLTFIKPTLEGKYEESPTITYAPLSGEKFVRKIMTPISSGTLLLLYHSGWSLERLLRCVVYRMNNLYNAPQVNAPSPDYIPPFEDFIKVTKIMRSLQTQNKILLAGRKAGKSYSVVLHVEPFANKDPEVQEMRRMLGLQPDTLDYPLVTDIIYEENPHNILLGMRSLANVLSYLSHGVEVPKEDQDAGVVSIAHEADGSRFNWLKLTRGVFTVRSGSWGWGDAAIAVKHRGTTFYIEDSDLTSKSTFMMLTQIANLQSGETKTAAPVLTIPVSK
ncbi:MAG: hypothetical protein GY800_03160 [Planctomycetes bacterium]|nr:hypothetical protein [Planctomycetota bacterium]